VKAVSSRCTPKRRKGGATFIILRQELIWISKTSTIIDEEPKNAEIWPKMAKNRLFMMNFGVLGPFLGFFGQFSG